MLYGNEALKILNEIKVYQDDELQLRLMVVDQQIEILIRNLI